MPVDSTQLATDLDFIRRDPRWQSGDETQRRDFARQIAVASAAEQDPEQHQALVSTLWQEADPRGWVRKSVDFMGTSVKEIAASAAATGPAFVMAGADAVGLTDTGAGTRLKRGVADLRNAEIQTVKQFAPGDAQEQMAGTLDALREDIHAGAVPASFTRWLAGDEQAAQDPEAKRWIDGLTQGLAGQAVKADTRLQFNPGLRTDAVTTTSEEELRKSWLASDRNPANAGIQDDGSQSSARDHLADYLVTRDPASWQQFVNRVTETESQHKTRVARSLTGEAQAGQVMQQMGVLGYLGTRGMDMQTSPIDLATAGLPVLRGMRLLEALQGGAEAGSVGRRIAQGMGTEALQEGVTEKLQDARATNLQVLEVAAMGAIGTGALESGMAGAGRVFTSSDPRFAANDPEATAPPPEPQGPDGTTEPASRPPGSGEQAGPFPPNAAATDPASAPSGAGSNASSTTTGGTRTNGQAGGQSSEQDSTLVNPVRQFVVNGEPLIMDQPTPRLPDASLSSASVNEPPAVPLALPGPEGGAWNAPEPATDKAGGVVRDVAGSTPATGAQAAKSPTPDRPGSPSANPSAPGPRSNVPTVSLGQGSTVPQAGEVDLFGNPIEQPGVENVIQGVQTEEVPLGELRLSRDVPQFKAGADDTGIVEPLAGKYERMGTADMFDTTAGETPLFDQPLKPGEAELFRTAAASAFERASFGDEAAYEDLDAVLRARYGRAEPVSNAEELSRQAFTQAGFEQAFEEAFARKDFDAILDAMKMSDRAVYAPLLKRFFAEQADNPQSAVKADWMRHVFNGTRPADAVAGAAPQARAAAPAASVPPPTWTPPPARGAAVPPGSTTGQGGRRPPVPPVAPPPRAPRIAVAPISGRLAKSPYRIINDFSQALGKHLRTRRLRPSQLGVYRPGSTLTAVKFAGDLDTAAHELAGHWVDDKVGLGRPWMKAKTSPYDAELAKFWIHGSPSKDLKIQRAEGIAEWLRAYVMDPAAAMAAAPTFAAYVQQSLPADMMRALNGFSDEVRTWAGENPLRRTSLNIRMERPSRKERLYAALFGDGRGAGGTIVDQLAARFSDNYHFAVKGFETALKLQGKSIKNLKPSENFDLLVRWLAGYENRFGEQLENGLTPLKTTQAPNAQGKLEVQRVLDPVTGQPMNLAWLLEAFDSSSQAAQEQDMQEASALMVAERTLERARQIDAAAAAQLAALPATGSARTRARIMAEAEQANRSISGIGAGMMSDVQEARETITALDADPNKARRLREAARRYRAWANANLELLVEGGRLTRAQVDRIKAANAQYVDMHRLSEEFEVESMVAQSKGGSLGTAKELMKRFKGSTLEIDNVYASLLKQTEAMQKEVARNRVMQTFVQQLESARGLYDGAPVELDRIGSRAAAEDRNTITVYRNGKAEFWKLDKDIHAALKGFGELGSNELLTYIGKMTGVIRYVITRSPGFALRNPLRDTIQRSVVSGNGSRPWDILQGYTDADKQRLQAFGGGMFGYYGKDRYAWNRELERGMKELRRDPRNLLMTPLELWKGWEKLLEATETAGRVAEFRRAYDQGVKELGYSPDEAALYAAGEARGLMDFAKMGTWMRQINQVIPFSNAALRGLARSASAAVNDPVGFGVRWTLFVALPTLAVRMLAKQAGGDTEDEYQQLPAWQRDFFWNVKVGHYWLRIPKPHELGVMAGGVERALSRELGEKNSFDGFGGSVSKALLPVGDIPSFLGPLKAPAEVVFNRDTFRDRDIVPIWERDLKIELRKGAQNASMPGQAVGRMLGVDPRNIDHLLGSFGGLGTSLIDFTKPERRLGESALKSTGLVLPSISSHAKDYQWVVDWAKANGKLGDKHVEALRDLSGQVYKAKDPAEADALAKLVRQQATAIRRQVQGY